MLRRAALAVLALACLPAQSQLFRTYVSSTGLDTNPCTLQQPCRLLPAAIAAVQAGGEVWMLDSANYNTASVTIAKSLSILAVPGVVGSVVATGGSSGLFISASGGTISLRNLVIVHLTSSTIGIFFAGGSRLDVADCEIVGPATAGILASAAGSQVTVRNTVLRGSNTGFYAEDTTVVSLDGVHATDNVTGIVAAEGARVAVRNSVLAGNQYGLSAVAASGAARLVVEDSSVTGNDTGITASASASGGIAHVTVSRSDVSHNSVNGFSATQNPSATAILVTDGNTVTHNGVGFNFGAGPPTIFTRGNNVLNYNTFDVGGGSLTTLAAQ
jgi:hypothetical protein